MTRRSFAVAMAALVLSSCGTAPRYHLRKFPGLHVPSARLSEMTIDWAGGTHRSRRAATLDHPGGRMCIVAKDKLIEDSVFSVPLSPGTYEVYEWIQDGSAVACLVTRTQAVDLTWTNPKTDHVSGDTGLSYLASDHRRFLFFPTAVKAVIDAELSDNSRFEDAFYSGNFKSVEVGGKGRNAYLTTPGLGAPTVFVGHDLAGESAAVFLYAGDP